MDLVQFGSIRALVQSLEIRMNVPEQQQEITIQTSIQEAASRPLRQLAGSDRQLQDNSANKLSVSLFLIHYQDVVSSSS